MLETLFKTVFQETVTNVVCDTCNKEIPRHETIQHFKGGCGGSFSVLPDSDDINFKIREVYTGDLHSWVIIIFVLPLLIITNISMYTQSILPKNVFDRVAIVIALLSSFYLVFHGRSLRGKVKSHRLSNKVKMTESKKRAKLFERIMEEN